VYLYRSVDKQGKTVESYLSRTRDVTAAKAFFRKALKRFFNAWRVVAGVELVQKIVKGQFDVPASFGTDPFCIWYNMLAA
jgi:hypothetical protein